MRLTVMVGPPTVMVGPPQQPRPALVAKPLLTLMLSFFTAHFSFSFNTVQRCPNLQKLSTWEQYQLIAL